MNAAICGGCMMPLGPTPLRPGTRWLEPHTKQQCAIVLAARAARLELGMLGARKEQP